MALCEGPITKAVKETYLPLKTMGGCSSLLQILADDNLSLAQRQTYKHPEKTSLHSLSIRWLWQLLPAIKLPLSGPLLG